MTEQTALEMLAAEFEAEAQKYYGMEAKTSSILLKGNLTSKGNLCIKHAKHCLEAAAELLKK